MSGGAAAQPGPAVAAGAASSPAAAVPAPPAAGAPKGSQAAAPAASGHKEATPSEPKPATSVAQAAPPATSEHKEGAPAEPKPATSATGATQAAPPAAAEPKEGTPSEPTPAASATQAYPEFVIDDGEDVADDPAHVSSDDDGHEDHDHGPEALNQYAKRRNHVTFREDLAAKARPAPVPMFQAHAHKEEEEPLPVMEDWMEKASPNWLVPWQRRRMVLKEKQFRWYKSEDESSWLGMIDFDLVATKVRRLYGKDFQAGTTEQGRSSGSCCAGGRKGCSSGSLSDLLGGDKGARFRLCPNEGNRAFEFWLPSVEQAEEWVTALEKHISRADRRTQHHAPLNTFGMSDGAWWKVSRISPDKFEHLAKTGDVLLFRSKGTFPKLIRTASGGGRFDHVALILRLDGDQIGLLEATGNEGVGLCTWAEFIQNDWQSLYPELAVRRVMFARTPERLTELQKWVVEVMGKPYGLTVGKLLRRQSTSATPGGAPAGGDGDFFCSQLVAEGLKVLGVIPRGKSSTQFWPSSFSAKMPKIQCNDGCEFAGEDLTIDFSLGDTAKRPTTTAGSGKNRDATTNWG